MTTFILEINEVEGQRYPCEQFPFLKQTWRSRPRLLPQMLTRIIKSPFNKPRYKQRVTYMAFRQQLRFKNKLGITGFE